MSVIAFHEKAGRSQVDSCRATWNNDFFSPAKLANGQLELGGHHSRDYLSRSRHSQEEARLHQNREARLVAIREEISSLTLKRPKLKH
jgi:hypothetical protein